MLGSIVKAERDCRAGRQRRPAAFNATIGPFYSSFFTYVNIARPAAAAVRGLAGGQAIWACRLASDPSAVSWQPMGSSRFCRFFARSSGAEGRGELDRLFDEQHHSQHAVPALYHRAEVQRQAGDRFVLRPDGRRHGGGGGLCWDDLARLQPRGFALVNAVMVVVCLSLAWRIGKQYKELTTSGHAPVTTA